MITYEQGVSQPDITIAVLQNEIFSKQPMLSHERVVTRIGRNLIDTMDKGLVCRIDKMIGLECYVDAEFARGCSSEDPLNTDNLLSRLGFVTH